MQRKPSCATTKLMLFNVSKDEWNTTEDIVKSVKNTLGGMPKGTSWAEVTSNSEKIKPITLAFIELC